MTDDEKLLFRAYLGLRVLKTMCAKAGLKNGEAEAADIIRAIEVKHPLFPAKAALR